MNILYIDGVGPFGGASRSLYEVMNAFPEGSVARYFVVQEGSIRDFYGRIASGYIATRGLTRFDNSRFSHYRGVRWLVLLRELFHFPYMIVALIKARRRWPDIDLIHLNEITDIVPGLIAKLFFRVPMIVHTRSLQRPDRRSLRTRLLQWVLLRWADAVIAIDDGVRATLPQELPVTVIHNTFTANLTGESVAEIEGLRAEALKIGFVGALHRAKGLSELLEATRIALDEGADVQLLIVGGATSEEAGFVRRLLKRVGLDQNMRADLPNVIEGLGLERHALLMGFTTDIQSYYRQMDVLAFPSYFNAPGRPVFEAAFFGVPAIVAVNKPNHDTVVPWETAIAVEAPEPRLIADAILYYARDRSEVTRMGINARALARRNCIPANAAKKLHEVYRAALRDASARSRSVDLNASVK